MTRFRAALIQMRSSRSVDGNIAALDALVREAAAGGAVYVQTPETTGIMDEDPTRLFETLRTEAEDRTLAAARGLARELGIHLHLGSLAVKVGDGRKAANRAFVIGPTGEIVGRHRKINVVSDALAWSSPGDSASPIECDGIKVGLLICSDVYTPNISRALKIGRAHV